MPMWLKYVAMTILNKSLIPFFVLNNIKVYVRKNLSLLIK